MNLLRAIDPSIALGSLYDRHQDCVSKPPTKTLTLPKIQLYGSIRCEVISGNPKESENLLEMIGIDNHMRLNILLKSAPRTGIAAVVDHSHPIDKYTRFLYIFYADREQRLPDDPMKAREYVKSSLPHVDATHIITAVSFGIDIVVVLQLPCKDNLARKIDIALNKIRAGLNNFEDISSFFKDDEAVLTEIDEITAYSNVPALAKMTSLLQICQYINGHKKQCEMDLPLFYTLQPIGWLYSDGDKSCVSYIPLNESVSDKLEKYLIEILNQMKKVKYKLYCIDRKSSPDYFKESLAKAKNEWQNLQQEYEDVIERLKKLVIANRIDRNNTFEIEEALKHKDLKTLENDIRQLMKQLNDLEKDTALTNNSQQTQELEHRKADERQVSRTDNEQTLNPELTTKNEQNRMVSPNEASIKNNHPPLAVEPKKTENRHKQTPSSAAPSSDTTSPPPENEIITILLLGESGVGKSTFINAFVNYLKFQTLTKAESCKPVVLIPVSFLLTIGDHFEEKTITFGDSDDLNNEDFDHPGQSVTQHCKSYVFKLNDYDGRKMRIIDTPGFGDTRGLDQDDFNMKHILEYINNLKYLNAICFLLKPNVSQIHNFFRDYLTQILDILGSDFRHNIVFCFTNSRSTFYTPGDTAPLLKRILKTLSMDDLPFNKGNTFCFDNESFRYLVALQKSVTFDKLDKAEYENSWSKSVDESKRLLDYVCAQLSTYPKQIKWQSIKHAQLQITYMIRPMLEAMRNILRNIIIREMDSTSKLIELKSRPLYRPASVCFTCKRELIQKGKFWILCDVPHEIQKACYYCDCGASQHMPIHYKLEYEDLDNSSHYSRRKMERRLDLLCNTSVEFAHFLLHVARSSKDDPFFIGITQMISEENDICKRRKSNNEMNLQLVKNLTELWQKYEQKIDSRQSNQQDSKLSIIYEWIQDISKYSMVEIQMSAMRETKEEIMKLYEYEVPENQTNRSRR